MALPFAMPALPRWAWIAIGAVLLLLAFYVALDRYGDARFKAGHEQADKEWQEASARLVEKAHKSASKADAAAAARAEDFTAKVEAEKERIDAAVQEGSSPMDVLFGGSAR